MRLADKIKKDLMRWSKGNNEIIIPNFFYGGNECDLFKITMSDLVVEYEIKISRADFFKDFEKSNGNKHKNLSLGEGWCCPNRFYFVVPEGLVQESEVPKYAGLLFYKNNSFHQVKTAKIIHKTKFINFRKIAHNLAMRCDTLRSKIEFEKIGGYERRIRETESELANYKKMLQEVHRQMFAMKRHPENIKP